MHSIVLLLIIMSLFEEPITAITNIIINYIIDNISNMLDLIGDRFVEMMLTHDKFMNSILLKLKLYVETHTNLFIVIDAIWIHMSSWWLEAHNFIVSFILYPGNLDKILLALLVHSIICFILGKFFR